MSDRTWVRPVKGQTYRRDFEVRFIRFFVTGEKYPVSAHKADAYVTKPPRAVGMTRDSPTRYPSFGAEVSIATTTLRTVIRESSNPYWFGNQTGQTCPFSCSRYSSREAATRCTNNPMRG